MTVDAHDLPAPFEAALRARQRTAPALTVDFLLAALAYERHRLWLEAEHRDVWTQIAVRLNAQIRQFHDSLDGRKMLESISPVPK